MNAGFDFWTPLIIVCMAVVTIVTRSFFFISSKPWALPRWAQRGLQYAPIAALAAVIVPEMVMTQGQLISTWHDARLFAVVAGVAPPVFVQVVALATRSSCTTARAGRVGEKGVG